MNSKVIKRPPAAKLAVVPPTEEELFNEAFTRWLCVPGSSCWQRDVLRACRDELWAQWQRQAAKSSG